MSDVLALPEFDLGIPIPDCNLSRPAPTGVPLPPWGYGFKVSGHVEGLHPAPSNASFAGLQESNPNGSGRSIRVILQSDMNADASSYLRSGPTYFGWVPAFGSGTTFDWRPRVWLIANFDITTGQQIQIRLRQYDANDSAIGTEHSLVTLTSADNTGGEWRSFIQSSLTPQTILATCTHFRVYLYFNASGLSTQNSVGIDFLGLGWNIGSASDGITDNYQPDGYEHGPVSSVDMIGHGISGAMQSFPLAARRGVTLEEAWSIRYERCTQATRDILNYYWRVGRVTPSAGDKKTADRGELIGKPWPILIRPNRPGVKEAFYAVPLDPAFPLVVDAKPGFVESTSLYTGTMHFREQSY